MRVALVTRAFRPRTPFDPSSHVRSIAPALARSGVSTEVFCATRGSGLAPLSQRRIEVLDHVSGVPFGVTTLEVGGPEGGPDADAIAAAFGAYLDRERPDVVHVEQLDAFGPGLVREVRARGIASIYCASDTWPAHDRTTQTLPDLSPFELGDGEAEARSIMATEELGEVPPSGRFDDAARDARLKELLHDPLTAMDDVLRLRSARERVEHQRATKRVALSGVDRRFATSRLLSKELSAAVGRAFTFRAAGVDTSLFNAPTVPAEASGPTRYVFLGTTAPTGGVDVLLDAFGEARAAEGAPQMQLTLLLEADDPARDAEIAARADLLGVDTRWTRGAVDVAGALADCDALVAPALWGETQTSLCRVALAAGRPVVASRTPGAVEALPSSCARFVTPGSAEELAAELTRLAGDGTAFADLARAAVDSSRSTKSTDDEAREWLDTYTKVVEETLPRRGVGRRSSEIEVLPGLHDVAKSFATLERMSMTELFQRAQDGVTKLKKAFGLGDSTEDLLLRVIARGGDARDRAGQLAGLRQELTESLENLELTRAAMHREEAERQGRVADLHGLLGQYEREVQSRGEETARAVKELRDHVSRTEGLEGQVEELEETARALDEKRRTAAEELDAATGRFETLAKEAERTRDALAKAEDERATFETTLSERDALVRALRDRLGAELAEADDDGAAAPGLAALERDLEGIEAFCVALEQDARTLRTHDEWMREETGRIFQALGAAAPDGAGGGSDEGGERAAFERGIASLEALRGELDWRRTEMEAARAAGSRLRTKVLAGPLVARVKDWDRAASRFSSVPDDRRAAEAREGDGAAAAGAADRVAAPDTGSVAVAEGPPEPDAALPSQDGGEPAAGASTEAATGSAEAAPGDSTDR